MSDIAIKAENISKRYRIGLKEELHDTFIGALTSWVKYPLSNLRRLQKLSEFSDNGESEDIIWALRDVSFEVKHGEVLGIIGRNGAGKSTLLKILCRITKPTSGRASLNGRVASLLEVGTGFHGQLTGRENVFLNGAILGMKKNEIERKFDEIVDFSGIEKFIDTPVKRYSSGMHVRLAFAVAAHLDPEILLIDEVLAVGDFEFQKKCLGKMSDVASEGRTILFVSHNMKAVKNLCGRAILLRQGELVSIGTAAEVIDEYIGNIEKANELLPEISFPPDSNKRFQIRAVRILDNNGNPSVELDRTQPFRVVIDYDIREDTRIASVEFALKKLDDTLIHHTSDTDLAPDGIIQREQGSYTASVEFPGYLLNAGTYRIDAFTTWDGKTGCDQPETNVVFHLRDYGTYASFAKCVVDSQGQRRGVLAIPLEWDSKKLE